MSLLPEDTHPNPEPNPEDPNAGIPPLPDSFVRYSNNWRDGIRQFQLDLQNGRYDPEWLHQAEEARKQRQNGDFDSFKEREFEQFWGQKQRYHTTLPAGESSRVTLETLADAGVIQVGDVWKFEYTFGKKGDTVFIEKEARVSDGMPSHEVGRLTDLIQVQEIKNSKLTFVIPSGQSVLLSSISNANRSPKSDEKDPGIEEEPVIEAENSSTAYDIKRDGDKPRNSSPPCSSYPHQSTRQEHPILEISTSAEFHSVDTIKDEQFAPDHIKVEIPASNHVAGDYPEFASERTENDMENLPVKVNTLQHKDQNFQVIISHPAPDSLKRNVPEPAMEPPIKRKRGRPRRSPLLPSGTTGIVTPASIDNPNEAETENNMEVALRADPESESTANSQPNSEDEMIFVTSPNRVEHTDPTELPFVAEASDSQAVQSTSQAVPESETKQQTEVATPVKSQQQKTSSTLSSPLSPPPSSPIFDSGPEEIVIPGITTPHTLGMKILEIDGRKVGTRINNAWKSIRCYRKNQDMGSLWDIRLAWFQKQ